MAKKSGWVQPAFKIELKKFKQSGQISVGIHEDAPDYDDGTDLSMVANMLEFGSDMMPEYRWLETSIKVDTAVYTSLFTKALKRAGTDKRLFDVSMDEIGRKAVEAVQQHLESNDIGLPSNAVSTQESKGGNSPLINTRHMIRNIDHKREK